MQKKSSFENFESALYSTSVSMPLMNDVFGPIWRTVASEAPRIRAQ